MTELRGSSLTRQSWGITLSQHPRMPILTPHGINLCEHSTRFQLHVVIGNSAPRHAPMNSNRMLDSKNSESAVDILQPDDHYIPSSASSLFRPHRSPAKARERWGFLSISSPQPVLDDSPRATTSRYNWNRPNSYSTSSYENYPRLRQNRPRCQPSG